jgi:ABC-type Fe3+ transport system permease subunit
MKTKLIILILAMALALVMMNSCTKVSAASLFGPSASEQDAKQRLISTETQLNYQRHSTENMAGAAVALGFGCILLLLIGTAMGSKIRRHYSHAS